MRKQINWSGKSLNDLMGFGKYKTIRVGFCIENFPEYVEWAVRKEILFLNKKAKALLKVKLKEWNARKDVGTRVHKRYEDKTEDLYSRFTRQTRYDEMGRNLYD